MADNRCRLWHKTLRGRTGECNIEDLDPLTEGIGANKPVLKGVPKPLLWIVPNARQNTGGYQLCEVLELQRKNMEVGNIAFLPIQGNAIANLVK